MIPLTLIVPNYRYNYHKYLLFLSRIQNEFDCKIVSIDQNLLVDKIDLYGRYSVVLNRYCYIDFKGLDKLIVSTKFKHIYHIVGKDYPVIIDNNLVLQYLSSENKTEYISKLNKINIHKYCYMTDSGIIGCDYHKGIFVSLNDSDNNFYEWLCDFHIKQKKIYYKGEHYNLKIGKSFLIKNNKHIGILPNNIVVSWDNKKNIWKRANKNILNTLKQRMK